MEYSFDINYAQLYGINEAIMIKNFQYWITKNKSNDGNFHDGKTWTYNSVNAFTALFPFWSYQKICRILKSLITQKVLMVGNYNRAKYDRTKWYAFVCEETFIKIDTSSNQNSNLQDSKMKDATIKSDTPIPNGKQQIQTQIENQLYKKIIAIYNGFCLENWDAPAKINGIEGKATKEIIKYLRTICKVKNLEINLKMEPKNQIAIALQTKYSQNINNPIGANFKIDVLKMKTENLIDFVLSSKPQTIYNNYKTNEEKTIDILMLMLIQFQDFYNCKTKMDKSQLMETSYIICEKFRHYNYYDIGMTLKVAKINEKIYDRIDGGMILEWLMKHDIKRTGLIINEREKQKTKQNSEWANLSERSSIQKLKDFLR